MRRIAAVILGATALIGVVAPSAGAAVDPAVVVECLTAVPGEVTGLIDPAAPGLPTEVPAVHCLAP